MYGEAGLPSPEGGANATSPQPGATAAPRPKAGDEPEEEEGARPEPVLVKVARREILDHERKRRVELKCMELQEMMEEQGYSEEEIRQKVGTFRQMLMEKEGVITREGSHPRPPVTVITHGDEDGEGSAFADGYEEEYGWHGGYYDPDSVAHDEHRMRRRSSSSPSPPPKKRKKKKGRRHTRVDSCSPARRGKRKKSGKKHKRDRSVSGSRRKRRHRSGTPKNKHKDKNKLRKKSPADCPSRRPQRRGSCCSSRSVSASSIASVSRSPSRSNLKHRTDRPKPGGRCSHSPLPSPGSEHAAHRHNGHHGERVRNGKDSRPIHLDGEKVNNKLRSLASSSPSEAQKQISPNVREAKSHGAPCRSPGGLQAYAQVTEPGKGDERPQRGAQLPSESSGRRVGRHRTQGKNCHSPEHSSDSQTDLQPKAKNTHQKKAVRVHHECTSCQTCRRHVFNASLLPSSERRGLIRQRGTTVGGAQNDTAARLRLRPGTDTRLVGRRTNPTGVCVRGAAPAAAASPLPAPAPESTDPAKPSPHIHARTTPGRGIIRTILMLRELAAVPVVTLPSVRGGETLPVSWRPAELPARASGQSRTTGQAPPPPAQRAATAGPAAAAATATPATPATAGAGAAAGAGATAEVKAGAGAGTGAAPAAPAKHAATTVTAAMRALASEE